MGKNKEIFLYLFFGGLTSIVSIVSYSVFFLFFNVHELLANVISWILSVLFAYVTNKRWVFQTDCTGMAALFKEMISFFGGRVFTLFVEEIILYIFVLKFDMNSVAIKIAVQIVVIVMNYIINKMIVFKKGK